MTTLTFRCSVQSSFRQGVSCPIPPTVTLDVDPATLTQAERDLIALHLNSSGTVCEIRLHSTDPSTYVYTVSNQAVPVMAATPTLSGLLEACSAAAAERQAELAVRAANAAEEAERVRAKTLEILHQRKTEQGNWTHVYADGHVSEWSLCDNHGPIVGGFRQYYADWPNKWDETVRQSPEAIEWLAKIERANDTEAAALVAEYESRVADRRVWIWDNGSVNLRRMMQEDMQCNELYETEHAAWSAEQFALDLAENRPGWVVYDGPTLPPPKRPGQRSWALLDLARLVAPDAKLAILDRRTVCVATYADRTIIWPRD